MAGSGGSSNTGIVEGARVRRAEVDVESRQAACVILSVGDREVEVHRIVERLLLEVGKDHASPGPAGTEVNTALILLILVAGVEDHGVERADVARWKDRVGRHIVVQGQADLLEIVDALGASGGPLVPPGPQARARRSGRR